MTAEQLTADAMYQAVLESPDCDTTRLAYADALAEAGDEDRAEFVRLQVALPDGVVVTAGDAANAARQVELLARHRDGWLKVTCPECRGVGGKQRKLGNSASYWEPCQACESTGDATRLTMLTVPENTLDPVYRYPVTFRRGLPDRIEGAPLTGPGGLFERREGACLQCFAASNQTHPCEVACRFCGGETWGSRWRPAPLLLSWLTHHPSVTCVVPGDREPRLYTRRHIAWYDGRLGAGDPFDLPGPVYDALTGGTNYRDGGFTTFPTRAEAVTALGRAVVLVARRHLAGSPGA